MLISHDDLRIEFELLIGVQDSVSAPLRRLLEKARKTHIGMPPLRNLRQNPRLTLDANDRMVVVELLREIPEEVDQESACRLVVEGLEDGRERVEVVEKGDVVAFEGEVFEGGGRGKRKALEVAAYGERVSTRQ